MVEYVTLLPYKSSDQGIVGMEFACSQCDHMDFPQVTQLLVVMLVGRLSSYCKYALV